MEYFGGGNRRLRNGVWRGTTMWPPEWIHPRSWRWRNTSWERVILLPLGLRHHI